MIYYLRMFPLVNETSNDDGKSDDNLKYDDISDDNLKYDDISECCLMPAPLLPLDCNLTMKDTSVQSRVSSQTSCM